MKYTYYIADVFSRQIFNGAQIAVLPRADGLSAETMAMIARELNLSETVFIFHGMEADNQRQMRIFSPLAEIDFAGHPLIAAGYVLGICGDVALTNPITPVVFEQNAGVIKANISVENGQPSFVQFSRSVKPLVDHFAPSDEELAQILNITQSELDHKKYSPRLVSCGFPYLVVPVWNYDSVRKARFDYAAWSQSIAPQTAAQEILLFAPKSPFADADFNVRLLGPRIGLHDDPPVGSAMPAFCGYLCSFEHTLKGTHTFNVDRGQADTRRSVISLEMDNKREESLTVRIGGHAVLVAQGELELGQP
ncbi:MULTISPECIES: PhzF family phenazine biosynthesis protein [Methylomonas]|uniref:Phenazine biosynthesis protein PhzF n=2 Tax=Methylomonas TaxID=416 RepID=A0A140E4Z8_9GAMM|nr:MULTISPECIES: PhzF family phenazine biosynthesis protein [Methylomonas]AMK75472.1 phenazine biosynthesis protein PhzF [Methylomonas denitrificans]OAI01897.1 phenazine biosynthesis protein PhzF [Methylomonas methanica]TCV80003.1 trans-2,3-dihydro-3-hydroxyanthranilate isomerase [Methylomonas methanica]